MELQAVTAGCATLLLGLLFSSWIRSKLFRDERVEPQGNTVRDTLTRIQDELGVDSGVGRSATRLFDLAPIAIARSLTAKSDGELQNERVREKTPDVDE